MGLLNLFAKPMPTVLRLPSGSFSVDREGNVLIGTLPSSFPADRVADIAKQITIRDQNRSVAKADEVNAKGLLDEATAHQN